jgi:HEAT repeat protein
MAPLAKIATKDRLNLTKEVVAILGRIGGDQILPYLIKFSDYKHKAVRLEIIHALSKIEDKATNTILISFLSDEDGEVRTRSAMNLKYYGNKNTLNYVMKLVQEKDFNNKSKLEKKALLNFLASTKNGKVAALLHTILKKWNILSTSKHIETRLCVVSALATLATPEAEDIIREGTKIRNKAIRNACSLALKKIATQDKLNQTPINEQGT